MKKIKIPKDPRMLVYWYHLGTNEDAIWIWYKDDSGLVKYTGILANGIEYEETDSIHTSLESRIHSVAPEYFTLIHAE